MRGILYKLPFLASFLFMSLTFAQSNDYESEAMVARSNKKSRSMNNRDMMNSNGQVNQEDDSLCFEPRCGCDEDYRRCCFGLPLPVKCGWAFIEAEYLYLKTYSLTPYASERYRVPPFSIGANVNTYSSNIHNVPLDADSGFRVALGVYFSNCSFGTAKYTQYSTDGSDSFSVGNVNTDSAISNSVSAYWLLNDLFEGDTTGLLSLSASAKNRFRMEMLDFDFNTVYTCSRYSFSPFLGVRFAWVKSDLRVDYVAENSVVGFPQTHHVDVNHHLNLGVGLHTGMDMNVDLCWGFGLYGTSSFSALIGQKYYRVRDESVLFDSVTNFASTSTLTQNYKDTDFQMNGQAGLGLTWGKHFCKCCYYLGLKLGYELHYWPNFVSYLEEYNVSTDPTTPADLFNWRRSVLSHGLNVGARFDF